MIRSKVFRNSFVIFTTVLLLLSSIFALRTVFTRTKNSLINETVAQAGQTVTTKMDTRYETIQKADIAITGNSLMLSPSQTINTNGVTDYGAVFTSLNQDDQVDGYPSGTTDDWRENGSSAYLDLEPDSEILFALIVWGGAYESISNDGQNVLEYVNSPVTLSAGNESELISPDPEYSYQYSRGVSVRDSIFGQYLNTRDITDFVREHGFGDYSINGVPAVTSSPSNNLRNEISSPENYAGWSIAVVYSHNDLVNKYVSLQTGIQPAVPKSALNEYLVLGNIPKQMDPPSHTTLHLVASEGDSNLSGDQILIGTPSTGLSPIKGDFNRLNNFFASQILDSKGQIDSRGSFGNLNTIVGESGNLKRQGWDIATLDITDDIRAAGKEYRLLPASSNDGYSLHVLGLTSQIDGAQVQTETISTPTQITLKFKNTGNLPIQELQLFTNNEFSSIADEVISLTNYPEDKVDLSPRKLVVRDVPSEATFAFTLENTSAGTAGTRYGYEYTYQQSDETVITIPGYVDVQNDYNLPRVVRGFLNVPPVVIDDIAFTQVNEATQIKVVMNDSDIDSGLDIDSLRVSNPPLNGKVTVTEDFLLYNPDEDFVGQDKFVYEICDNQNSCKTGEVIVSVEKQFELEPESGEITDLVTSFFESIIFGLDAFAQTKEVSSSTQVLNADHIRTTSSNELAIDVTSNDTLANIQDYNLQISKAPENGIVSISGNYILYTPKDSYSGTDFFVYALCNQSGECYTAPVNITVELSNSTISVPRIPIPTSYSGIEFSTTMFTGLLIIITMYFGYAIFMFNQNKNMDTEE